MTHPRLSPRPSILLLVLIVAFVTAGLAQRAPLVSVPQPGLDGIENPLRDELISARANLDDAVADTATETVPLANAFGLMGTLYLAVEQHDAARACLTNATRLAPDDARWYMSLGVSLLNEDDRNDEALAAFETALRLTPDDPVVHLRLGQLLASEPDTAARSIPHLRAARAGLVDNVPILVSLGKALAQTGEHNAALEPFDSALALDADNLEALNYRARARSQLGDDTGAALDLRRVVDQSPINKQARFDLAAILTRQGNFPAAEAELEAALTLELKPNARILALFSLAGLRQQVGDNAGAIGRYQELLELAPDLPDAHFNLGVAFAREGRFDDAIRHFERTTQLTPAKGSAWIALARALASADRNEDAVNAVERGLQAGNAAGMKAAEAEQLRQLLGDLKVDERGVNRP